MYKKKGDESRFLSEQFEMEEECRDKRDNEVLWSLARDCTDGRDALLRANVAKRAGAQSRRDER